MERSAVRLLRPHRQLEAPGHTRVPRKLEGGAGVGLLSRLIQRNQPAFVLHIGFQLHVGRQPLDYIEAKVSLGSAAGDKVFRCLATSEGNL